MLREYMMPSLANYIRRKKLTYEEFGEKIGVTRDYVSKLIRGYRTPSAHLLRKLHETTRIPLKRLLYECTDDV
jgi:transcriptional regulator with XRE-family HTH domain